jgi:mannose-6-phosphate isomerase-like protein (cupin superfamily)
VTSAFPAGDPRNTLSGGTGQAAPAAAPKPTGFGPAEYVIFHDEKPAAADAAQRTWWARGNNFYIAYTEAEPGTVLTRAGQPDESVVLLPDPATRVRVTAGGETVEVPGYTVSMLAAGDSTVEVLAGGTVIRLFTAEGPEPAEQVINAVHYTAPKPNVAPLGAWPEPAERKAVRTYSLDVAKQEGRFGRIFRSSTFMVNWIEPYDGPRDPRRMSPHHHDDFEQCSLALEGEFEHHIRWPWISDSTQWREDEHTRVGSPSIAVIPPPTVHTTRGVGAGHNQMVDIFCPPRHDFAAKPGWVLNAADYPDPA